MSNLILIDADHILYKTCPNRVLSETERMYGVQSEKTLQETLDLVDWYLVEKIFKPTNANSYIGFLGGKGNFRMNISKSYKEGRSDIKPPYFNEAKQHLVDKWGFVLVDEIEAEDAVGICLTKYPEAIIVRVDHDLDQLEGVHFNPTNLQWKNILKDEAIYTFWRSMITGCTSDKVKGIVNNRKRFADKVIGKYIPDYYNSPLYMNVILKEYIALYGEYKGIEQFALNYKLLKILREKEDFIIPEPSEVPTTQVEQTDLKDLTF